MGNKKKVDAKAGKGLAGLAVLIVGVAGFGWWRSRAERQRERCKVVEESVYRGFKYRIEECPSGESRGFLAIVPSQQVGTIQITEDEGDVLEAIEDARKYAQMLIDAKITPKFRAVFVGTNR